MAHPVNSFRHRRPIGVPYGPTEAFTLLSLFCCTGAVSAACVSVSAASGVISSKIESLLGFGTNTFSIVFIFFCLFALTFLLGSSYYGYIFIPLLSALFGFVVYFVAGFAIKEAEGRFSFILLLSVAVPLLVSVPCFFVSAADAFATSRQLKTIVLRRCQAERHRQALHFAVCIPILAFAAFVAYFFGSR